MFTPARRQQVIDRLLERARTAEQIVGAARTGSAARGALDRWSDIDLFFGVRPSSSVVDELAQWSRWMYAEMAAVHHFDRAAGPATYRAFLLSDGLEVDLGFTPAGSFGPVGGGAFDVVFGDAVTNEANASVRPDVDHLLGLGWHHAAHARAAIARGDLWPAEHWTSALRDHTLTLACIRHGVTSAHAKGARHLPAHLLEAFGATIVTALTGPALAQALTAAVELFLSEAQVADPAVAARLAPVLRHGLDDTDR